MRGADTVARELIRTAVAKTYDTYFKDLNMQQGGCIWFELGGEIKLSDTASAHEVLEGLKNIQGLTDKLAPVGIKSKEKPEVLVSAAEFVLEGLHAHRRIGRSEERVFGAEKQPKRQGAPHLSAGTMSHRRCGIEDRTLVPVPNAVREPY